jgi:serine/threonine protein kinase
MLQVWSLGMIMYELMTLQRPFADQDAFKITELTLVGSVPPLGDSELDRYPSIIPLFRRCLRLQPTERISATDLRRELSSILELV